MIKKLGKDFNRALIKRFEGLPNVAEFRTHKLGIHEYAAIYGITKIERFSPSIIKLSKNHKPNVYLERQIFRITRYVLQGDLSTALWLSERILRRSKVYRTLAMNRVCPDWYLWKPNKLRRVWRRLDYICKTMSTELKYDRIWITNNSIEYGRPLGAPHLEWRILAYMQTDIWERLLKAQGAFSKWQHGGRSGKGVLTCWQEVIPKLKQYKYIYEFDLKGFYNTLSQDVIFERMKEYLGPTFSKYIRNILDSRPNTYTLPSEELALQRSVVSHASSGLFGMGVWSNPYAEFPEDSGVPTVFSHGPLVSESRLMMGLKPSAMDLARGLEMSKGMGIKGRGVPQGLSWSPLVSTVCVDLVNKNIPEGSLTMYMDDGLIFANTLPECENIIEQFKNNLKAIGSTIEPRKSGYIKATGEWIQENPKFLGLRYLPKEDNIQAATRSGTTMKFPATPEWDTLSEILRLNYGLVVKNNDSLDSVLSGFKAKFDRLLNTKAYEAGLRYGFLGTLIAQSQTPNPKGLDQTEKLEEMRALIKEGESVAWGNYIKNIEGFIWKFQDMHPVMEDLTNLSSLAVFKYLASEEIRELGMHTPRKAKRKAISRGLIRELTKKVVTTVAGEFEVSSFDEERARCLASGRNEAMSKKVWEQAILELEKRGGPKAYEKWPGYYQEQLKVEYEKLMGQSNDSNMWTPVTKK
jgi:hypothetical protein